MSDSNDKQGFWHALKIFKRELDECEREVKGEIPATNKHIDTHLSELEDRAGVLLSTFKRLFGDD